MENVLYILIEDMGFRENRVDIPCTIPNDKFVLPRILSRIKSEVILRAYRFANGNWEQLKGEDC